MKKRHAMVMITAVLLCFSAYADVRLVNISKGKEDKLAGVSVKVTNDESSFLYTIKLDKHASQFYERSSLIIKENGTPLLSTALHAHPSKDGLRSITLKIDRKLAQNAKIVVWLSDWPTEYSIDVGSYVSKQ